MRIGVNALFLIPGGASGGTEVYLRETLSALAAIDSKNEYFIFTNAETGADLVPRQANFHWKPQAVRAVSRPARILWEQTVLPIQAARCRLDVLYNAGFTAPVFALCGNVTLFHDLIFLRQPQSVRAFDRPFWKALLWAAVRRSRRIIVNSAATRDDFHSVYRFPRERVCVASPGVEPRFFSLDRASVEPFVLCVSALLPHKNHIRLIKAYARKRRPFRLVLAGMRNFYVGKIEKLIADLGVGESVQVTGWLPELELLGLYQRAHAFIYPSLMEGFGMPVLEAMAAGIPTACSSIPSLLEAAGTGALFFDPLLEDAIEEALDRITGDAALREKLKTAGPKVAQSFTWKQTAERTLAAFLS